MSRNICLFQPSFSVLRHYYYKSKLLKDLRTIYRHSRRYNSKSVYSHTVFLPKSDFPVRVSSDARVLRDKQIQEDAKFSELYYWQQVNKDVTKTFCIHDGPPYANGMPHIGHALNRILKDITNRYKLMQGYNIHFVPGWDCHGLPIELKCLENKDEDELSSLDLRLNARNYASKCIKGQKKEFQKWGILADWENCYYTFSPEYVSKELKSFYEFYNKGLIFRDFKPVYWSPYAKTALAEAELEYDENYESTSVFVKYPMMKMSNRLTALNSSIYALIWTTTPWTLPSNKAICFNPNELYTVIKLNSADDNLIISDKLLPYLSEHVNQEIIKIISFMGSELIGNTYKDIYNSIGELPFIPSNHVTTTKGTGLVHTAPSHGHEDYKIGLEHYLPNECVVDESGRFVLNDDEQLNGKFVLTEGNEAVLEKLNEFILHKYSYVHSYPLDWRTKKPIIIRSCKQWFMNTELLKLKAMENLRNVSVYPPSYKETLINQLENRPYWCISRQRKWGVPIPVLYDAEGNPVINLSLINHYCNFIESLGPDFWWKLSDKELLSDDVKKSCGLKEDEQYVKGNDILDIWFDSGLSWNAVLGHDKVADYYIEGVDQIRGWFQSSLLTRTGISDGSPYKKIHIHGFALDEKGRKMSKSLGNVIEPGLITDGGKNKKIEPAYGIDVLRWWVAKNGTGHMNVHIGKNVMKDSYENIQKLRLIVKFILGSLRDFEFQSQFVEDQNLGIIDKFMLNQICNFSNKVTEYYENFLYHKICHEILNFVATDVSALYCHIIKDRLYCDSINSKQRRSCQTVLHYLLDIIVRSFAPILPHLAEEVFLHHPESQESVFKSGWLPSRSSWQNQSVVNLVETALSMRTKLYKDIQCNSRELELVIYSRCQLLNDLKTLQPDSSSSQSDLCELFQVSTIKLGELHDKIQENGSIIENEVTDVNDGKYKIFFQPAKKHLCARCRKYTSDNASQPCSRCLTVMGDQWA